MQPKIHLLGAALLAAAALAGPGRAQLAQSASYQLDDAILDGAGGGTCSIAFAGWSSVSCFGGDEMTSASFRAELGFLAGSDPQPTSAPVVLGVSPPCGPVEGGTPLTVSGLQFDKFGVAPSIAVTVGGVPATGVSVLSDTLLTCLAPGGTAGPKTVTVTSSLGSGSLANAFEHSGNVALFGTGTPGCDGTQVPGVVTCPMVGNAEFGITCTNAPASSLGLGMATDAQDVAGSDPFGIGVLLHVDLLGATEIVSFDIPSDSSGFGSAAVPLPALPALAGKTYHVQMLWAWTSCSLPPYGLSTSRGMAVTIGS